MNLSFLRNQFLSLPLIFSMTMPFFHFTSYSLVHRNRVFKNFRDPTAILRLHFSTTNEGRPGRIYNRNSLPESSESSTKRNTPGGNFRNRHFKRRVYLKPENTPNRPFTLPPGEFRPKQSLGQNYLSDQNYVMKIVDAFDSKVKEISKRNLAKDETSEPVGGCDLGETVVEIGPGLGALTRVLSTRFPRMTAVEIDQRAVSFLGEKIPALKVIHRDVLEFDWREYFQQSGMGKRLSVIGNLPYNIVSQVLFSLADASDCIDIAVVTMQLELAERINASPNTKTYGIPSVVFQLYGKTSLLFKLPPNVFFPAPKVDSALVSIDFTRPHPRLQTVRRRQLRKVLTAAFRQRRKMLRQSLKDLLRDDKLVLPSKWSEKRPEQLTPEMFLDLSIDLYGEKGADEPDESSDRSWRRSLLEADSEAVVDDMTLGDDINEERGEK